VRHATTAALDELEQVLNRVRLLEGLVEKKRGVFYRNSKAFLHFHEDPSGLHADVRLTADFERLSVQTDQERDELLKRIAHVLAPPLGREPRHRVRTPRQTTIATFVARRRTGIGPGLAPSSGAPRAS
jgi:hypothetical protein